MAEAFDPFDALAVARHVAAALEGRDVPYAIGGALAYGLWAIPRGTLDVDINIFVEPDELAPVFEALAAAGVELEPARALSEARREGMFMAKLGRLRLDVFTPSIPFSREAERTRARHVVDGQPMWFLSAEALAVFKLMFFRGKDIVDLERLVAVQGPKLDVAYVRARIVEMLGDDDERVATWDGLVRNFGG